MTVLVEIFKHLRARPLRESRRCWIIFVDCSMNVAALLGAVLVLILFEQFANAF